MPEKLKQVTLGHWIATAAFLLNLAAYTGTQFSQRVRMQAVLEALAVEVTETKLALSEHAVRDDTRWEKSESKVSMLQSIVNEHGAKLYHLERKNP